MRKVTASLVFAASLAASASAQIVNGQIDTFDTDIMGWFGATPIWTATGGPGSNNPYMQLTSTGQFGQSGRMAVFNSGHWSGSYTSAGVTAIGVDFKNNGPIQLEMRLTFHSQDLSTQWVSNFAAVIPSGSAWQHFTFDISESLFTLTDGSQSFDSVLGNVGRTMFRHDPGAPSSSGVIAAASLGVDNIQAVPEPASLALLGIGFLAIRRKLGGKSRS